MRKFYLMLVLLLACAPKSDVVKDARYYHLRAHEFTPPPEYADWWKDVEQCSGKTGDFSRVRFFEFDTTGDHMYIEDFHENVLAWWEMVVNEVTFVGSSRFVEKTVKHEMLHAILNRSGHPKEYFDYRCGL